MPQTILVSIAAALAGKGASALYDVVKEKFAGSPEVTAALANAQDGAPDSPHREDSPMDSNAVASNARWPQARVGSTAAEKVS